MKKFCLKKKYLWPVCRLMFAESKGGKREGYREGVRERVGKREQDGEWERNIHIYREISTQVGEESINVPSNRGRVGPVNSKIGWTFVTCNDLWGHPYEIFVHRININFYRSQFINECARKIKAKIPESHSFRVFWDR